MSVDGLLKLVREAEQACEARTCERDGHAWETDGARQCPRGGDGCSQSFYVCRRCGAEDYGEPGGPGHADCWGDQHRLCDGSEPPPDHVLEVVAEAERVSVPLSQAELDAYFGGVATPGDARGMGQPRIDAGPQI